MVGLTVQHPFLGRPLLLLLLILVDLELVDESFDLSIHDVTVFAPEDLREHGGREVAEFFAAADGPFGGNTACMLGRDSTLRGQELHEEVADLLGSCCLFGQGVGGL